MKVYVLKGKETTIIDILKDVYYIDIKDKVIQFHIKNEICQQLVTIRDFETWLANHGYIKTDKSHLVNLKNVKNVDFKRKKVILKDGTDLSISRRNISNLRKFLKDHK